MRRGHFREGPHHRQGDQRARDKAQNHRGASELYRDGAAEKQPGTDGAAETEHGELRGLQAARQARLASHDGGSPAVFNRHLGREFAHGEAS
jgi:hypothetical protein